MIAEIVLMNMRYDPRVGDVVFGEVTKLAREGIVLRLGGAAQAFMPRGHLIPHEAVRLGSHLCALLSEVRGGSNGRQMLVSRTAPALLIELLKREVPPIRDGEIEVVGSARDPGSRAKVAVRHKADTVALQACVGAHAAHIRAVSKQLNGERVDVIGWDENPARFVVNAMAPADVVAAVVDETTRTMDLEVHGELAGAIGPRGQNVRLASQLTGWKINVANEKESARNTRREARRLAQSFMQELHVGEEVAAALVEAGFSGLDEVESVCMRQLLSLRTTDDGLMHELSSHVTDALLTHAIAVEERRLQAEAAEVTSSVSSSAR